MYSQNVGVLIVLVCGSVSRQYHVFSSTVDNKYTIRPHVTSGNIVFLIHSQGWASFQTLRWRHNDHAGVSNHQPPGCLLNRLFRRKSKKTSKLRVTGLCAGNSPGTGEFSAQMASYAENVSIWWRHHGRRYIHPAHSKAAVLFVLQTFQYGITFSVYFSLCKSPCL